MNDITYDDIFLLLRALHFRNKELRRTIKELEKSRCRVDHYYMSNYQLELQDNEDLYKRVSIYYAQLLKKR